MIVNKYFNIVSLYFAAWNETIIYKNKAKNIHHDNSAIVDISFKKYSQNVS